MLKLLAAVAVTLGIYPAVKFIRKDYERYLALGPGGTPQTFQGYLRIKVLGLIALRDLHKAIVPTSNQRRHEDGYLTQIPQRKHDRPRTEGIAPHRQTTQQAKKDMFEKLAATIEALAPGANQDLTIRTSCFEKHCTGLFSTCPVNQTCDGEIVHAHPSDGSMHMTLHTADANMVLKAGWGERHPLAGVLYDKFVPEGYMMIYAPQNEEEIDLILRLVRAAYWWVSDGGSASNGRQQEREKSGSLERRVGDPKWSVDEGMNDRGHGNEGGLLDPTTS